MTEEARNGGHQCCTVPVQYYKISVEGYEKKKNFQVKLRTENPWSVLENSHTQVV